MRVAFFGTPDVAVPSLQELLAAEDIEVLAVVTNPDRPRGRSRRPVAPPVKEAAAAAGVDVWQPQRVAEILDDLRALQVDCCAVVAYGALLPASVLDAGGAGFVNLHFSLLPRWRGAAPVQHAIRAGDEVTGVTTFVIDEGMDTGPILRQVDVPIEDGEDAGHLLERLALLGAPILADSLRDLVGGVAPSPQPSDGVTMAPKVHPEDVEIDWHVDAAEVVDLVRSASPHPGAFTTDEGQRLKVYAAVAVEQTGEPGTIVDVGRDGAVVACGRGAVLLTVVQPAGKGRMDGSAYVNGYRPALGHRYGT
jgi:methionyl-tRNA formyltransferase